MITESLSKKLEEIEDFQSLDALLSEELDGDVWMRLGIPVTGLNKAAFFVVQELVYKVSDDFHF